MDGAALEKSTQRLRIARDAHKRLALSENHQEFSDNWYTLITAAKSVWTILEQGAKTSPQSRQWFGAKKRQRRGDELLQYMFEARNSDEHGLEAVVWPQPPFTMFDARYDESTPAEVKNGKTERFSFDVERGIMNVWVKDEYGQIVHAELPMTTKENPARSRLARIIDRSGKTIQPPAKYLGEAIPDDYPETVAELNLKYLESLIAEAVGFHKG